MSDNKPYNPPAFPGGRVTSRNDDDVDYPRQPGMDLRDYFAGQALIYLMNALAHINEVYDPNQFSSHCARKSYELADAMLAERERAK